MPAARGRVSLRYRYADENLRTRVLVLDKGDADHR
jgi:hypothetical protein